MPRTLSGLVSAEFDSIDVFHSVLVRGSPGQVQTVLTSDGVGCDWAPVTLDANAVDTLQIKDDAVIGTKIKDNAVTTDKILNLNVTNAKLQHSSITLNGTEVALGDTHNHTTSLSGTADGDIDMDSHNIHAATLLSALNVSGTTIAATTLNAPTIAQVYELTGGNIGTAIISVIDKISLVDANSILDIKGGVINNVGTVTATTGDFTNISVGNAVVSSTPAPSNYLRVPSGITTFDTGTTYGPIYTGHLFSGDISSSGNIVTLGNIVVGATGSITGWGTANISDINTVSANTGNFTNSGATTMTGDLTMGANDIIIRDFIIRPPGYAYTVGSTDYRKIPILPNEFMPNDDSSFYNLGIENDTNQMYGWVRGMNSGLEMMAHISIPDGYTFCGIKIFCRHTINSQPSPAVLQLYKGSMIEHSVKVNMFSNTSTKNCNNEYRESSVNTFAGTADQFLVVDVTTTSAQALGGGYFLVKKTPAASGGGGFTSCTFENDYLDNFNTSPILKINGKPTGASTFIVGDGDVNVFTYGDSNTFNYQLNTAYAITIKKADGSDWTGYSFGFSELINCTLSATTWNGNNSSPVYITFTGAVSSLEWFGES